MSMGNRGASGRLWARWLLLAVFVVGLSVTFVNLGQWQLDRLDQRRNRNSVVVAHENSEIRPYEEVMTRVLTEEDQWQRVTVSGTFLADQQFQVRYRSNAGRVGWELVTPLAADDGRVVLVDRGFAIRPAGEDFPQALPEPPAGRVTVVGHVRRNEVGKDVATVPQQGSIRLVNSVRIGEALGRPLVDGYIGLLTVDPPQTGEFMPVEPPEVSDGPHFWYAVQWFMFTAIAAVGLVVFIRNDVRDRRRAAATR